MKEAETQNVIIISVRLDPNTPTFRISATKSGIKT